jgi:hypothetical protein
MKLKLYVLNLFSGGAFMIQLADINKVLALLVMVTAILLNIKRLFEKPKK